MPADQFDSNLAGAIWALMSVFLAVLCKRIYAASPAEATRGALQAWQSEQRTLAQVFLDAVSLRSLSGFFVGRALAMTVQMFVYIVYGICVILLTLKGVSTSWWDTGYLSKGDARFITVVLVGWIVVTILAWGVLVVAIRSALRIERT